MSRSPFFMQTPVPVISTRSTARVPPRWRGEVERVLITDQKVARRIRQMSLEIEHDFTGREMVVVSLLNGTVMFLADLVRNLSLPSRLDFIGVCRFCAGARTLGPFFYEGMSPPGVRGDMVFVGVI